VAEMVLLDAFSWVAGVFYDSAGMRANLFSPFAGTVNLCSIGDALMRHRERISVVPISFS